MLGYYIMIAHHNPKKYPQKPLIRFEGEGNQEQSQEEISGFLSRFFKVHNKNIKNDNRRNTSGNRS